MLAPFVPQLCAPVPLLYKVCILSQLFPLSTLKVRLMGAERFDLELFMAPQGFIHLHIGELVLV